jgi:DNA helicase-2/ATP-dependent DNA helicase PcrA
VRLLSSKHRNLCVVGDEDQSIYSWRGATIRNIMEFERDYPDATTIKLEENYRSSGTILEAASSVIQNNRSRKGKELWTKNGSGPKIVLLQAEDGTSEARQVIDKTLSEIGSPGRALSEICILYRTNAQSRAFEEEARRMGVPYVIVGGVKFYERKEVKDIIAYLSILANVRDDIALKRVINVPSRGLGAGSLSKMESYAKEKGVLLWEVAKDSAMLNLSAKREESLRRFTELIDRYRSLKERLSVYDLMKGLVEETGYVEALEREGTKEALNRAENVEELLAGARRFCEIEEETSLETWLSRISLFTDIDGWDEKLDALVFMTAHNAKGLEFPVVFLTGLEEGLFPHHQSLYPEEELEEERRLFYVGMTRAREKLILSYALRRMRSRVRGYQRPSRFIDEIPRDLIFLERALLSQPFREGPQSYR